MTDDAVPPGGVPVSRERVNICLASSTFWTRELPKYADSKQFWADNWAIAAGILAALTSLAIFPILDDDSTVIEKAFISLVALAAAICALIPRVKNYAELAGAARELSSRYGSLEGDLIDLSNAKPMDQERARTVVVEFQATKEKKDALRGLPDRATVELRRLETERRLAEARSRTAEARTSRPSSNEDRGETAGGAS
jgi:hypothetical protein